MNMRTPCISSPNRKRNFLNDPDLLQFLLDMCTPGKRIPQKSKPSCEKPKSSKKHKSPKKTKSRKKQKLPKRMKENAKVDETVTLSMAKSMAKDVFQIACNNFDFGTPDYLFWAVDTKFVFPIMMGAIRWSSFSCEGIIHKG